MGIKGRDVRIRLLIPSRVRFYNICVISDRTVAVAFINPSSVYSYTPSHDHNSKILEEDGINRYLTL